jgi:hypothetical protein
MLGTIPYSFSNAPGAHFELELVPGKFLNFCPFLFIYFIFIYLFIYYYYYHYYLFSSSSLLLLLIFEIFDLMLSDWVSFLAYPNLFGIKSFVVVVIGHKYEKCLVSFSGSLMVATCKRTFLLFH